MKAQLARGVPVIFSMRIGTKMRGHRGDSIISSDFGDLGGHTMIAVGYDETRKAFRIQNSWGRNWADGGYGWFSYDFWKRNARVGYVIERPIWKTSYRLRIEPGGKVFLQGWAMVENTSDDDWNNVRMALVSGRPISFEMNLYQPLYIPRPFVEPEMFASPVSSHAAAGERDVAL